MAPRLCTVSWTDEHGATHRVQVRAVSLYEAVGLAVQAFRGQDWVPSVGPATRFRVAVRQPSIEHEATVAVVQDWTDAMATSPADKLLRARVRSMLLPSADGAVSGSSSTSSKARR